MGSALGDLGAVPRVDGDVGLLFTGQVPHLQQPPQILTVWVSWGPRAFWGLNVHFSHWELTESPSPLNLASTNIRGKVSAEFVHGHECSSLSLPIP